jgi:hypothetical protein
LGRGFSLVKLAPYWYPELGEMAMNTLLVHALTTTVLTGAALGDVYVEIDFANSTPNGQTDGSLIIDGQELLSVYIWADESGVLVEEIGMDLDGLSMNGLPDSGGNYQFHQLGDTDPTDSFFIQFNGGINADGNRIQSIAMANAFIQTTELPTSSSEALVIYDSFQGSALESGSGVMPIVQISWSNFQSMQPVHTYGMYQTPTPGTLGVLAVAWLCSSRRRM